MSAIFRIMNHELRIMVFVFPMILASLFIIHPVYAQTTPLPPTVAPTSPLYTDLLVHNLFHSFSCLAIGQSVIGQPCLSYVQGVPVLSSVNVQGGTLGAVTGVIGALYQNPPVKTRDYLASLSGSFGVVREANAQVVGSGEQVLNPILKLWQVSRNISYVLMIIIFLVIGLMVMFRNKINPQTVISAQAALPGLVIGLIMITFSYFFAGLISDMAFVGTNIVGYYFAAAQGKPPQNLVDDMKNQNVLKIVSPFTGIIDKDTAATMLSSIWGSLSGAAQQLLTLLAVFITGQTTLQATEGLKMIPKFGELIQVALLAISTGVTIANPTAMIGLALAFIATAILLYSMFKLLLRLINNFITIIFLTVTAPFQFLAAALPGRQDIATGWILNMLANILAFPAVLAVLYFVAFLVPPAFINNKGLNPPFRVSVAEGTLKITDTKTFPLFGGLDLSFLNLILAFGALMALPSIPDIIGRTVGRMSQTGQIIGQEIGGAMGQGRQYAGQFQQGVGAASGQIARARGLFSTPGYRMVAIPGEFEADGITPKYRIAESFEAGRGGQFGALSRKGIIKPPKLEPGVGI